MPPLTVFPLPLQTGELHAGYAWSERVGSDLSTSTGFTNGLNERDQFLGRPRCIICGRFEPLHHSHLIPKTEQNTWADLKRRGWLPQQAKDGPQHEPRNGFLLCVLHRTFFDEYRFFIRFLPDARKFVLINYSNESSTNVDIQQYHGKAVALNIADRHAPFPSLFIIHEMRVRGFHPFHDTSPDLPDDSAINWQDWIMTSGAWDNSKNQFHRHALHGNPGLPQIPLMTPINASGGSASGIRRLDLNEKVISDILAATHTMPSWKECEVEGTRWTGTAEQNKEKYLSISISQAS